MYTNIQSRYKFAIASFFRIILAFFNDAKFFWWIKLIKFQVPVGFGIDVKIYGKVVPKPLRFMMLNVKKW